MTEAGGCILTADAGGTFIKSALFAPSGAMLSGAVDETPVDSADAAESIERAVRETGAMLGEILRPVLTEHRIECLFIGGQIARAAGLFEGNLRTALEGVPSLRAVQRVSDFTVLPLRGVVRDVLRNAPLTPPPARFNAGQ